MYKQLQLHRNSTVIKKKSFTQHAYCVYKDVFPPSVKIYTFTLHCQKHFVHDGPYEFYEIFERTARGTAIFQNHVVVLDFVRYLITFLLVDRVQRVYRSVPIRTISCISFFDQKQLDTKTVVVGLHEPDNP